MRNLIEKIHIGFILNRGFPEKISWIASLVPQAYPKKIQIKKAPTARAILPKMMSKRLKNFIFVKNSIPPQERAEGIPTKNARQPMTRAAFCLDQLTKTKKRKHLFCRVWIG